MNVNAFISSLPKIRTNGAVFKGSHITATRNDGRIFTGQVVKVAAYLDSDKVKVPGDMLVVIRNEDSSYRSFYLSDMSGWLVTSAH